MYDPGRFVVIDVRTQAEWDEGHMKNAIHIDVKSPDFEKKIGDLDKEQAYIVYCRKGGRSSKAQTVMVGEGFQETYNVVGGILSMKKTDLEIVRD
jgi:rhodanese-related sulfurtransferase